MNGVTFSYLKSSYYFLLCCSMIIMFATLLHAPVFFTSLREYYGYKSATTSQGEFTIQSLIITASTGITDFMARTGSSKNRATHLATNESISINGCSLHLSLLRIFLLVILFFYYQGTFLTQSIPKVRNEYFSFVRATSRYIYNFFNLIIMFF